MGNDLDSQLRSAARSLAEQLSDGILDRFSDDKKAAERRLSMHIAAGDIDQETVNEIFAAHAQ